MTDREIADLINKVTEIARQFAHTQQLRARISSEIVPVIRNLQKETEIVRDFLQEIRNE